MDINDDGLEDIISGSYHPGDLYLFTRKDDGSFAESQKINGADGYPVNAGAAAHGTAFDWDGDGDLDLIVGNIQGEVFLVSNDGSRTEPKYGKPQPLQASGKAIRVAGDAGPTVADWDSDGTPDLLVGDGAGTVMFYRGERGQGESGPPQLAVGKPLVSSSRTAAAQSGSDRPGQRTKVHAVDYTGDGRLDLLVGDFTYQTVQREKPLTHEEQKKYRELSERQQELYQQYSKAMEAAMSSVSDKTSDEEMQQVMAKVQEDPKVKKVLEDLSKLSQEISVLQPERSETHGYVWLYTRKADAGTAASRQ